MELKVAFFSTKYKIQIQIYYGVQTIQPCDKVTCRSRLPGLVPVITTSNSGVTQSPPGLDESAHLPSKSIRK